MTRGSRPSSADGRAHRGEVHEQRDAREVLQDDAGDHERDLGRPLGPRLPGGQRANVLFLDALAVAVAQQGLEDDADRYRAGGRWRRDPSCSSRGSE